MDSKVLSSLVGIKLPSGFVGVCSDRPSDWGLAMIMFYHNALQIVENSEGEAGIWRDFSGDKMGESSGGDLLL